MATKPHDYGAEPTDEQKIEAWKEHLLEAEPDPKVYPTLENDVRIALRHDVRGGDFSVPLDECENITGEPERIQRGDLVIEVLNYNNRLEEGTAIIAGDGGGLNLIYVYDFSEWEDNGYEVTNAEYVSIAGEYTQDTSHNVQHIASDPDATADYFRYPVYHDPYSTGRIAHNPW